MSLLSLEVFPLHPSIAPGADRTDHVLVRLRAPERTTGPRPRLTAVLCLDTSGSMAGEPIAQVMQSSQRLAEILEDTDALGVVAFDTGARTVAEIKPLSAQARRDLGRAIGLLHAEGNTNISGGLAHAALLFPKRTPGERQIILLLSDGQPNVGAWAPQALAEEVRRIRSRDVGVSTLGFGPDHSEEVLIAVADAGAGRYGFVTDPRLAGASFARALGAQRDIVAESVRLTLAPAEGVELVRVFGDPPTTVAAGGLRVNLQDLIAADELNIVVEVKVKSPMETGTWRLLHAKLAYHPAGTKEEGSAQGEARVLVSHVGPYTPDTTAGIAVAIGLVEQARVKARELADGGHFPEAAALLVKMKKELEGTAGYTAGSGPLFDAAETLADEVSAYERKPAAREYAEFKKATRSHADLDYGGVRSKLAGGAAAKELAQRMAVPPSEPAVLVFLDGARTGEVHPLGGDTSVGRAADNDVHVDDVTLSRRHARIFFDGKTWWLLDMKSTGGCLVNDVRVDRQRLKWGDVLQIGGRKFRFDKP
jgi:uncharacterized protein YegL